MGRTAHARSLRDWNRQEHQALHSRSIPLLASFANPTTAVGQKQTGDRPLFGLPIVTQRLQQEIERRAQFLQPAHANTTCETVFEPAPEAAHVSPIAAPACR